MGRATAQRPRPVIEGSLESGGLALYLELSRVADRQVFSRYKTPLKALNPTTTPYITKMPLLFDEIKAFLVKEKLNTFITEHPHVLAVSIT